MVEILEMRKNGMKIALCVLLIFSISYCSDEDKEIRDRYTKALQEYESRQRADSLKDFYIIYKSDPDYKETRILLGKLHYYDYKFSEAKKFFQEAYEKDSNNYNALLWVIKTQFALKEKPETILENLQKYLALDSSNIEALYIKGKILENTGKIDLAILNFEQITYQTGKIALAHKSLNEIYRKAGLDKKAEYHKERYELLKENKQ
ncbi:hypothetical protein EHO62_16835 [Leptospira kmetyi]|nr:hypothetical protein EHO62_16835 [Leptospira kmetyi]TGK25471.1 hypothetical protein EHO66_19000 [Leptospira kmetyi]TGL72800.1 hypothetical protein EHQ67_00065 [Leptospira kmetyi]